MPQINESWKCDQILLFKVILKGKYDVYIYGICKWWRPKITHNET